MSCLALTRPVAQTLKNLSQAWPDVDCTSAINRIGDHSDPGTVQCSTRTYHVTSCSNGGKVSKIESGVRPFISQGVPSKTLIRN